MIYVKPAQNIINNSFIYFFCEDASLEQKISDYSDIICNMANHRAEVECRQEKIEREGETEVEVLN